MRAAEEAAVKGLGIHVDDLADRGLKGIMLGVLRRQLEVVDVHDHHGASLLVPEGSWPFFGKTSPADGGKLLLAVGFPEATRVGMAIEGQH